MFREGADKTRALLPLTTFVSALPGVAGTDPDSLWKWLSDWEAKTGGHVLAIPHNGNMSNGWMFRLARYEVFQYKGQTETHPALSPPDEFADFEIWDTADLRGNAKKPGDIDSEYARRALENGLRLEAELGTNPFKFGMVSGTDTHTGLMTGGEEDNFLGKFPRHGPRRDVGTASPEKKKTTSARNGPTPRPGSLASGQKRTPARRSGMP